MKKIAMAGLLAVAPLLIVPPEPSATELLYTPVNPSFGGSPLNGSFLLSQAEGQNKFKNSSSSFKSDPFADFEESLNRRILGIVANQIADEVLGIEGREPLQEGHYVIGDFEIDVGSAANGVNVVITDPATGRQTRVNIPNIP